MQARSGPENVLVPAHAFVLKVVERCNIACDYCYMYEFDPAVSGRLPPLLSPDVLAAVLGRIRSHADRYGLHRVSVVLHGGEPLLLGRARFARYVQAIRQELSGIDVVVALQTNAVLLDAAWLDLLEELNVQFAISLDGPAAVHDQHRRTRRGAGTSAATLKAVEAALQHPARRLFQGILTVINPQADGADVLRFMAALGVPSVHFLLPDRNHATALLGPGAAPGSVLEYLCRAFDAWLLLDSDVALRVRLFEEVISGLMGRPPTADVLGNVRGDYAIIETDGGFLPHDVLRICGEPWDRSQFNVARDDLDRLYDARLYPWLTPPLACAGCDAWFVCRGGSPMHRYDGRDFGQPTVYCRETFGFAQHVARRLVEGLPPDRLQRFPLISTLAASAGPAALDGRVRHHASTPPAEPGNERPLTATS